MTEHGGGRDSGAGEWFKPSENRYRTQSEYQDPLEGEQDPLAGEESAETVFPDSGGYAGLSASRPALVEPYPEALGGPPSPASPSHPISYPGAGVSAYQPMTRVPGESDEHSLPSVAASAEVPLPPEDPGESPAGRVDSWANRNETTGGGTDGDRPWAPEPWTPEPASPSRPWDADAPLGSGDRGPDHRSPDHWNPDHRNPDHWNDVPASDDRDAWRSDAPRSDAGGPDTWGATPAREDDAWTPASSSGTRPWDDAPAGERGGQTWDAPAAGGSAGWEPDDARGAAAWSPDARSTPGDDRAPWSADAPAGGGGERARAWDADAPGERPDDRDRDPDGWETTADSAASSGYGASGTGAADARPWDDDPLAERGGEAWTPRETDARPWAADSWAPDTPSDARPWDPDPLGAPVRRDLDGDRDADAAGSRPDDRDPDDRDQGGWTPETSAGSAASSGYGAPDTGTGASDTDAPGTRVWDDELSGGGRGDTWTPAADGADRPWEADAPAGGTAAWDDRPGYAADSPDLPWDESRSATAWGSDADDDRTPSTWGSDADHGAGTSTWGSDPLSTGSAGERTGAPAGGWNDELSDDRGASAWGADAPADAGRGPDSWDAAPRYDAPSPGVPSDARPADGARSWDDDELGSDSWRPASERAADDGWGAPDGATTRLDSDDWRPTPAPAAAPDSWAPARETGDAWSGAKGTWGDGYDDELSPPTPDPAAPGGGSGNTWAFDRNDPRLPDVVREAERRRRESSADREDADDAWGGSDTAWGSSEPERDEDDAWGERDPADAGSSFVPSADDPLAAIADLQSRARSRDAAGYADDEDDEDYGEDGDDDYADAPDRRGGYGEEDLPEGATQVFEPIGIPEDTWEKDEPASSESEYDDGFTPADYGMPAAPASRKRRKDPIAEEFPGFVDRPLGGEAGDPYPGYDSIDFLPDTERGATLTLWLGLASLLPGIGLVTALLALLITGPRAKKAIRASRGELDGLGLITVGTVFAVVGILVTVISVAIWLVL